MGYKKMPLPNRHRASWFRTVCINYPNDTRANYIDLASNWVRKYNQYFIETLKIDAGKNVDCLYHRKISIIASGSGWAKTASMFLRLSRDVNMRPELQITISQAIEETSELRIILEEFPETQIVLSQSRKYQAGRLNELLTMLAAAKTRIVFEGEAAFWRSVGITSNPAFAAKSFFIKTPSFSPQFIKEISPCFRRWVLVIDELGNIYPCHGLVGLTEQSIGHISTSPKSMRIFETGPNDYDTWHRQGPKLGEKFQKLEKIKAKQDICLRHRSNLGV